MNKVLKSVVIIFAILFLLSPFSFGADETDFKEQIKSEDGSYLKKLSQSAYGGIAQTYLILLHLMKWVLVLKIMIV